MFNDAITSDKICRMAEGFRVYKLLRVHVSQFNSSQKSVSKFSNQIVTEVFWSRSEVWTPCESRTSFWRFKRKFCHHPTSKLIPVGTDISEEHRVSDLQDLRDLILKM